jgi:hypothetical protein
MPRKPLDCEHVQVRWEEQQASQPTRARRSGGSTLSRRGGHEARAQRCARQARGAKRQRQRHRAAQPRHQATQRTRRTGQPGGANQSLCEAHDGVPRGHVSTAIAAGRPRITRMGCASVFGVPCGQGCAGTSLRRLASIASRMARDRATNSVPSMKARLAS